VVPNVSEEHPPSIFRQDAGATLSNGTKGEGTGFPCLKTKTANAWNVAHITSGIIIKLIHVKFTSITEDKTSLMTNVLLKTTTCFDHIGYHQTAY
jgi:hypothetical protein